VPPYTSHLLLIHGNRSKELAAELTLIKAERLKHSQLSSQYGLSTYSNTGDLVFKVASFLEVGERG